MTRPLRVCWFGTWREDYSRNRIMIEGLRRNGVEVVECHAALWGGIEDRVKLARGGWAGPLRTGEGVRGKFLEALACGCPVVTTPLGASGIRAGEPEGLIVRQTAEEIAAAILELLPDPARRRQLGLAGREAVLRHHSRQAFEAAFAAGLDPLLARRGRPS